MKQLLLLSVVGLLVLSVSSGQQKYDPKAELSSLKKLEALQQIAKAKYQKAPKDVAKKKEYVALTLTLGNNVQASMALTSKEKYPKALRLYREVLGVDPKNAEAKRNKNRIESIYKSMGRPIPQ